MVRPHFTPQPSPMPAAAHAQLYIPDAIKALEECMKSWNPSQVKVHLTAALTFIEIAQKALNSPASPSKAQGSTEVA